MTRLAEKVAVITGAGTGIGQAIALACAEEGALIVAAGRRREKVEDTCRMIDREGGVALPLAVDVSKSEDVHHMVSTCVKELGRLDILVNNAGVRCPGGILALSEEQWDWVMSINLRGVFLCCKAAAPIMVRGGWGRIVNISSAAAITPSPNIAYSTSKGALVTLTKSMALELSPRGVTVNAVCPGTVVTDMTREMLSDPDVRRSQLQKCRTGRFGEPAEIAAAVVYLTSAGSEFVTGSVLVVDGGWTIA
jgi:NAD(P)-dependent dehydrogenase (short-subunit alcohol dehydrogenase family)